MHARKNTIVCEKRGVDDGVYLLIYRHQEKQYGDHDDDADAGRQNCWRYIKRICDI